MQFDPKHPERGWTPAVPLPLYVWWWRRCGQCGRRFWRDDSYRAHYLETHVRAALEGER